MSFTLLSFRLGGQRNASRARADIGQIWRFPGALTFVIFASLLTACGTAVAPDTAPPGNPAFAGVVAVPEPRAALIGRDVILAGGNAADAAAAMGMALAVTLPSRAGLNGGGACLVHDPAKRNAEVVEFSGALARGLAALQSRYGARPFANAVAPAETLARFGFPASKMLADDLSQHGAALMNDQTALSAFMDRRRQFAAAGTEIKLPALAETLARLRTQGTVAPGGDAPIWRAAESMRDTGYDVLGRNDGTAAASAGFVVGDKKGMAVACVLSMGAMFGAGRMDEGGALRAAALETSSLNPVIVKDAQFNQAVLLAAGAADGVKVAMDDWLKAEMAYDAVRVRLQQSGEVATAVCPTGLGVVGADCRTHSDARGFGLGLTFGPQERR